MSFEATVVRVSHEGSVIATFDGAVPQLGQRVKDGKGETIGRIDSVIGPISDPLTNIVILDPHLDPDTLIGTTLAFAPRARRDSRNQDRRRNSNRDKQDWTCRSQRVPRTQRALSPGGGTAVRPRAFRIRDQDLQGLPRI